MSGRVEVALQVAASPERAFDVFTAETALWWRPNALFGFTPREPGVVSFEPGEGGRFRPGAAHPQEGRPSSNKAFAVSGKGFENGAPSRARNGSEP